MSAISTIGIDADDTLWNHERYYQLTTEQFALLLTDFAGPATIGDRLMAAERRNLARYGYGVKGFTLSMIETAIEVTDARIHASVIKAILDRGRDLLDHPIAPIDGVPETLKALGVSRRLVLITKGDLFDQERKLAQSGLADLFHAVEIVTEKNEAVFRRVFERHGDGPARAAMMGDSIRSDILPALAAGAHAIHVPSDHQWAFDHAEPPPASPRFHRIARFAEAPALLAAIEAA
jgi:putative hydrolase of the HAD superfamily